MIRNLVSALAALPLLVCTSTTVADADGISYMQRYAKVIAAQQNPDLKRISCDRGELKSRKSAISASSECVVVTTKQVVGEHQNYRWQQHTRMVDYNNNSYLASHMGLQAAGGYSWDINLSNHLALQILGLGTSEHIDTMSNGDKLKVSLLGKYQTATGTAKRGDYQCLLAYAKRSKTSALVALSCAKTLPSRDDMKVVLKAIQ